jgi:hypothetical protein
VKNHFFKGTRNTYFPIDICEVKVLGDKDIRMDIEVNYETYKQIKEEQLFNLFAEKIEPSGFMDFGSELPIEMELRLDPNLVEILELSITLEAKTIQTYIAGKSVEGSDNLFIYHDSWFVLKTVQEESLPEELQPLGSIKTGFQTTWHKELS